MRILGVDPGTRTTGYGILDFDGEAPRCIAWGVLHGGPSKEIAERLHLLHQRLEEVFSDWSPDQLAIEEPFVSPQRGAKSGIAVGQAQAIALLLAAHSKIPIYRYAPTTVKGSVSNYGAGTKAQVQRSVQILLGLGDDAMSPDASDAIAIALCHVQALRAARITMR